MCVCVCRGGHLVDKQKKQKTQTIKNHIRSRPCYSCVFWPHQQLCVSNGIWRPSQSIHRHSISPLFFLFFFWLLFFTQAARQSQDSYHEKHREHPDDGEWRKKIPFSFLCQEWETCFFFVECFETAVTLLPRPFQKEYNVPSSVLSYFKALVPVVDH